MQNQPLVLFKNDLYSQGFYGILTNLLIIMRRGVEIMPKSKTAKNGEQRITTNRDNIRHLEYFNNGQWRHSDKCRQFTNKECTFKSLKSSF